MRINIFAVFLVFLFLVMPVSSAASADVKIETRVYYPGHGWLYESVLPCNSTASFQTKVTNQGPDMANITVKEMIPASLILNKYIVRFNGVNPGVENHTSYNSTTGIWTLNNIGSGGMVDLYCYTTVKEVNDIAINACLFNLTFTDSDLSNNNITVVFHTYRQYQDYFIKNGTVNSTSSSVKYQIKNNTKWTRNIKASSVAVQKYTVYAQDMRNKNLFAINKYTGNNRWYINLDKVYDRAQFLTGKYLVLMSSTKAVMVNLYTHKAVWGKNYSKADSYSLIKSKKNKNYYIMAAINGILKFFKINLS